MRHWYIADKHPESDDAQRITLEKQLGILTPKEEAFERHWESRLDAKSDEETERILDETTRAVWGWSRPLDRFPGNVAEYNTARGEEYELMSFEGRVPTVYLDSRDLSWYWLDRLMKSGACVGFVHYAPPQIISLSPFTVIDGYGLPIRKTQKKWMHSL